MDISGNYFRLLFTFIWYRIFTLFTDILGLRYAHVFAVRAIMLNVVKSYPTFGCFGAKFNFQMAIKSADFGLGEKFFWI